MVWKRGYHRREWRREKQGRGGWVNETLGKDELWGERVRRLEKREREEWERRMRREGSMRRTGQGWSRLKLPLQAFLKDKERKIQIPIGVVLSRGVKTLQNYHSAREGTHESYSNLCESLLQTCSEAGNVSLILVQTEGNGREWLRREEVGKEAKIKHCRNY